MGKDKFIEELKNLGYEVQDKGDNRVAIDYLIANGRFKDTKIKIGFEIPTDFEVTPPSGPHISPRLLAINPNGPNHNERAHESANFGSDWEYLSRPFPNWKNTKRTVKEYLRYVKHLLETL